MKIFKMIFLFICMLNFIVDGQSIYFNKKINQNEIHPYYFYQVPIAKYINKNNETKLKEILNKKNPKIIYRDSAAAVSKINSFSDYDSFEDFKSKMGENSIIEFYGDGSDKEFESYKSNSVLYLQEIYIDKIEKEIAKSEVVLANYKKELQNSKDKFQTFENSYYTVQRKTDSIINLQIGNEHKIDSLKNEIVKFEVVKKSALWHPQKEKAFAFYDLISNERFQYFKGIQNSGLNFGNSAATFYSELVSGMFRSFKISFGTNITTSSKTDTVALKKEEAYQRLINKGGNTVFSIEHIIMYYHTKDNLFCSLLKYSGKAAADFPIMGSKTNSFSGYLGFGIQLNIEANLINNGNLRFFGDADLNFAKGTSEFKSALGVSNIVFVFAQFRVGLILMNKVKLSVNVGTMSDQTVLKDKGISIGGQILSF